MLSKKFYIIFGVIFIVINTFLAYGVLSEPATKMSFAQGTIKINDTVFTVDIADTLTAREQGLSNRSHMRFDHGMYFIFPIPANYTIWMKEMKFPLDIIWIKNNVIIDITQNVPIPSVNTMLSDLPRYYASQETDAILELNAGTAEKYNMQIGQPIFLQYQIKK